MDLIVKGSPDQSFTIPVYDDTAIKKILSDHEARIKKLESSNPTPAPTPTRKLFSDTSFWNKKLSNEPLAPNSATLVNEIVKQSKDKNSGGIAWQAPWMNMVDPVFEVTTDIPKSLLKLIGDDGKEMTQTNLYKQLQGGFRIPSNIDASLGPDGSFAIWDKIDDVMLEGWKLRKQNGEWVFRWGTILKDVSNHPGNIPLQTNSSGGIEAQGTRASGLALAGGTFSYDELKSGTIQHALDFAIFQAASSPKLPATRTDGDGLSIVQEGQRFRFPANIQIDPNWGPIVKMLVVAVRDYGLIATDTSPCLAFTCRDIRQFAPQGTTDTNAWALGKYEEFYPKESNGAPQPIWKWIQQFPWGKLQALLF